MKPIIPRHIISASISSTLFSILFSIFKPDSHSEQIHSSTNYFLDVTLTVLFYIMFSLPLLLIYGALTILFTEKVLIRSIKTVEQGRLLKLHFKILAAFYTIIVVFFKFNGIVAISLFHSIDWFLQKRGFTYKWLSGIVSLALPLTVFMMAVAFARFFLHNN